LTPTPFRCRTSPERLGIFKHEWHRFRCFRSSPEECHQGRDQCRAADRRQQQQKKIDADDAAQNILFPAAQPAGATRRLPGRGRGLILEVDEHAGSRRAAFRGRWVRPKPKVILQRSGLAVAPGYYDRRPLCFTVASQIRPTALALRQPPGRSTRSRGGRSDRSSPPPATPSAYG